jgi:hypothetical protein
MADWRAPCAGHIVTIVYRHISPPLHIVLVALIGTTLAFPALPAVAAPLDGLLRNPSGPCGDAFQIAGTVMCTHGPDPIPDLVLARGAPVPIEQSTALSQGPTNVLCNGDGQSGDRVQALYAHVAGRADRKTEYLASFRSWAAQVDAMFQASAAESGGNRHLRWVTDSTCLLAVPSVALSSLAESNFATMVAELALAGYNRNDRKYLVWFDSDPHNSPICGIATVYPDDRASAVNLNDTITGYARADYTCWDWSEPHELMHTLGAVQRTAPHATNGLHCTDEYDQMCYQDGLGVTLAHPCPESHEQRYDCGHDDYFSVVAAPGSYLATHWNTANSGWLVDEPPDTTPPVVAEPDISFVAATLTTTARVRVQWPAAMDRTGIAGYELQRKKGRGSWTNVALGSLMSTSADLDTTVGSAYAFRVRATDGAGNTGAWTTTATRTLRLIQENATGVTYTSGFKRVRLSGSSGGYVRKSDAAGAVATFKFRGADVAFVTTLGPARGTAWVRVDGGAWMALDLYRSGLVTRYVAWAAGIGSGSHKVEVRLTGTANAASSSARIDIDAFLVWK